MKEIVLAFIQMRQTLIFALSASTGNQAFQTDAMKKMCMIWWITHLISIFLCDFLWRSLLVRNSGTA